MTRRGQPVNARYVIRLVSEHRSITVSPTGPQGAAIRRVAEILHERGTLDREEVDGKWRYTFSYTWLHPPGCWCSTCREKT